MRDLLRRRLGPIWWIHVTFVVFPPVLLGLFLTADNTWLTWLAYLLLVVWGGAIVNGVCIWSVRREVEREGYLEWLDAQYHNVHPASGAPTVSNRSWAAFRGRRRR